MLLCLAPAQSRVRLPGTTPRPAHWPAVDTEDRNAVRPPRRCSILRHRLSAPARRVRNACPGIMLRTSTFAICCSLVYAIWIVQVRPADQCIPPKCRRRRSVRRQTAPLRATPAYPGCSDRRRVPSAPRALWPRSCHRRVRCPARWPTSNTSRAPGAPHSRNNCVDSQYWCPGCVVSALPAMVPLIRA